MPAAATVAGSARRRPRERRAAALSLAAGCRAMSIRVIPSERPTRLQRRGGRRDRVVAALADLVLDHHVVVLVDEVVAVDHVPPGVRREPGDHADHLALADVHGVLRTELPRVRRLAVAIEDLEVDEVDVDGMEPAARVVAQLPDLDIAGARVGDDVLEAAVDDVVPREAVDRPPAVVALEVE